MPVNYEHHEQVALFQWAEGNKARWPELEEIFATLNGGQRHPAVGQRLREAGGKAGLPDIFLLVPRGGYHGLAIEMKRVGGGVVSKEQKVWLKRFSDHGYFTAVCHGWIEAKDKILGYLNGAEKRVVCDQ